VDKFLSLSTSFIDGNYSSMWLDISRIPRRWSRPVDFVIYCLAIVPVIVLLRGAVRSARVCRHSSQEGEKYFVVLVYTILALAGYVHFVLRLFSFATVKAFYLLSAVGPLAVFLCRGLHQDAGDEIVSDRMRTALAGLWTVCVSYYVAVPWISIPGSRT
jgi:hypothetical protein